MNPQIFLLISIDSATKQLLATAAPPHTVLQTAEFVSEGLSLWRKVAPTLVICDSSPETLAPTLDYARRASPTTPVVALGKDASVQDAVAAMRAGAADYLIKPVYVEDLRATLARSVRGPLEASALATSSDRFAHIISVAPQMSLIKQLAREVAVTDATVLITGESGTGKELFAQAIHEASPRSHGPLVALNCAGIPENLLEAELFGYQQGAFTDAKHAKLGRFQLAEGGTLFLDEIGEMSASAQAKLLRVLETHAIDPLGDTRSHKVSIRIIAATNEDLLAHIKAGRFRLDLYYRLNVYQLRIPPLRERTEDIEPILRAFLDRARQDHGCRIRTITSDALAVLQGHDWPGNVRELHNVVEWLTITCKDDTIKPHHLPVSVKSEPFADRSTADLKPSILAFGLSFQEMEKKMLEEALRKASGNISEASRLLKLTRNTFRYRMAKYHLQ